MTGVITITDVRLAGICVRGCRQWFRDHGFSESEFRTFLAQGLPVDELMRRGDGLVSVVLDRKEERAHGEQQKA